MAQTAQVFRETGMFSAEYFNTPLGDINIPAPIMELNSKMFP
jgi:hypothetical protein